MLNMNAENVITNPQTEQNFGEKFAKTLAVVETYNAERYERISKEVPDVAEFLEGVYKSNDPVLMDAVEKTMYEIYIETNIDENDVNLVYTHKKGLGKTLEIEMLIENKKALAQFERERVAYRGSLSAVDLNKHIAACKFLKARFGNTRDQRPIVKPANSSVSLNLTRRQVLEDFNILRAGSAEKARKEITANQ